jgi:hypothetical protein
MAGYGKVIGVFYFTKLNEGEYFGAFGRIHSLVEVWMENLFELKYREKHSPTSNCFKHLIPKEACAV